MIYFFIDNPLWFKESILRPSVSFQGVDKRHSTVLNSNTSSESNELSENWHERLPKSDSSQLIKERFKKNNLRKLNENGKIVLT